MAMVMYMSEYNLHITYPVGECFQRLVSNPETVTFLISDSCDLTLRGLTAI